MAVDRELFADSLPTYLTQFIGRADEINAVCELLHDHRLVSICGVGGAGKTRLAIEVARRRRADSAQEVHWVSLSGVSEDREVYAAVADGIGMTGQLPARAVVSALRHRRATIVLDNCEGVRSGCQELIEAILEDSTDVRFLTTTRVPVGTPIEHLYAIPPLSFRTTTGAASDASLLFVDRCRLAAPSYGLTPYNTPAIHDICDALNGLPLAIELVASWVRVLSPDDLLGQIRQLRTRIDSRSTIVEERHRSLDAVLASSWSFLDPESCRVLSALSVFVGGFTRNAAEVVAGADLACLATLIERALIQRLPASNGGSRYQMHALVRQYAWGQAECRRQARDRHAAYFADLVDTLEKGSWNTPVEPSWSDPIGADLPNIDEATRWSIAEGHAEEAARLAVGLDAFWVFSSPSAALRDERLINALAMRPADGTTTAGVRARAKATHVLGLRISGSNPAKAKPLMTEARQLFESIGDQGGAAAALRNHGRACLMLGDVDQCQRDVRESLARCEDAGDRQGTAWCFLVLGWVARSKGDPEGAVKRFIGARQRFEQLDSPFGACQSSLELGRLYADLGQWLPALDALHKVLVGVRDERFTANTADLMEVVAVIASFWEQNKAAAQLCGAICTWRETYEPASWTGYPSRLDATTRLLRDRLDNRTWAISYAAGRALTPEHALDLVAQQINELITLVTSRSSGLSAREVEILALVSEGLTNTGIASRLYLSPRTVGAHLRSIFTKLDVTTRTGAVHAATKLLPAPAAGVGTPTER